MSISRSHSPLPISATPQRAPLGIRITLLIAILVPLIGLVLAIVSVWGWGISWLELGLLGAMYVLTVLGITVGFHRLFTHRAFETSPAVQFLLGVLGSMAAQGPLLEWVAMHRIHHQHSDQEEDPHSPHHQGRGFWGFLHGLWHSHLAWLFQAKPDRLMHYSKDLQKSALLQTVSRLFPLWVALGLLIPAVVGGLWTFSWSGAFWGLIWGGLVRLLLVHHVTWSVNSVCHVWGSQPFASGDESRNNFLFGLLALGEGWHNTHHAFPTSARHGLRWWEVDVSYLTIRALACLGLAWNVKLPSVQA